jgi:uncharacterized protein
MLFDWDSGNLRKCLKHGVSVEQIEEVLSGEPFVQKDRYPAEIETRFRAIGKTVEGRSVFIVFTFRDTEVGMAVRPISARFMHAKEVRRYEYDEEGSSPAGIQD